MIDLDSVFREIKETRQEISGKVDCLDRKVGKTREDMAGLRQLVADHVSSPALHQEPAERPCEDLKEHTRRHWGVTLLAISGAITGLLAVLGFIFLALIKAGVLE